MRINIDYMMACYVPSHLVGVAVGAIFQAYDNGFIVPMIVTTIVGTIILNALSGYKAFRLK